MDNFINKKIVINSKEANKNSIFVCLRGKKTDGHKYIDQVLRNDKKNLIICKKNYEIPKKLKKYSKNFYKTKNPLIWIQDSAKKIRKNLDNNIFIGITGSSGKTTVKEMLFNFLSKYKKSYKSIKSFNNHIGLPLTLANQKPNTFFNIYEIGMNHYGEIDFLSKILKPNIGIITNIGEAHIGNFGSLKNIARAKSEIIKNITKRGFLIINKDDKFFSFFYKKAKLKKLRIITFSKYQKADVQIKQLQFDKIKIKIKNSFINLKFKNLSNFMLDNLLIILSVGYILKLNLNKIKKLKKIFISVNGRGNFIKLNKNRLVIDDSYNSNPTSLKNSLESFSNQDFIKKKLKIAVLGDMLELGKFSRKFHEKLGSFINYLKIDKVHTIGKNTSYLFNKLKSSKKGFKFNNIDDFKKKFGEILVANSAIMFKASNGTGLHKFLIKKLY